MTDGAIEDVSSACSPLASDAIVFRVLERLRPVLGVPFTELLRLVLGVGSSEESRCEFAEETVRLCALECACSW